MRKILTCCLCAVTMALCLSCGSDDPEVAVTDFENQNIPLNLCGTYYQVERGDNYYQYLTINPDGTMEGIYVSVGKSLELRGECYYREGEIIFYYQNGNDWLQLHGAERTVVEWTSEYLVLGYFNASILTKSKQTPAFINYEHNENLIGRWMYNQTETATSTLILDGNGAGCSEFLSPVDYSYDNIVSWFTFNEWLYIKYEGKSDYEIWRYNLSGEILNLYYCDVLEISDNYNYRRGDDYAAIVGTWRDDWGSDLNYDYTAFSFFEDGTGLYFDKGNPGKRFTYTYSLSPQFVEIAYNEYYKEQLAISKLTSNVLILDEEEYKKSELTYSMLIIGKWRLHVDVENSDEEQKSVVSFSPSGWYETKDYVGWSVGNSLGELQGTYSGEWSINGDRLLIEGESRIAGEYIIEGLVVNGCRLVRASNPDEYPYLIGGWYDR